MKIKVHFEGDFIIEDAKPQSILLLDEEAVEVIINGLLEQGVDDVQNIKAKAEILE